MKRFLSGIFVFLFVVSYSFEMKAIERTENCEKILTNGLLKARIESEPVNLELLRVSRLAHFFAEAQELPPLPSKLPKDIALTGFAMEWAREKKMNPTVLNYIENQEKILMSEFEKLSEQTGQESSKALVILAAHLQYWNDIKEALLGHRKKMKAPTFRFSSN